MTQEVDSYLPAARMLRLFEMLQLMFKRSYTPKQIAERLDCSERTAYRYMKIFETWGIAIDSNQYHYFVAQDDCPVCHHEIKTGSDDPFDLEPVSNYQYHCHSLSDYEQYLSIARHEENLPPS